MDSKFNACEPSVALCEGDREIPYKIPWLQEISHSLHQSRGRMHSIAQRHLVSSQHDQYPKLSNYGKDGINNLLIKGSCKEWHWSLSVGLPVPTILLLARQWLVVHMGAPHLVNES